MFDKNYKFHYMCKYCGKITNYDFKVEAPECISDGAAMDQVNEINYIEVIDNSLEDKNG